MYWYRCDFELLRNQFICSRTVYIGAGHEFVQPNLTVLSIFFCYQAFAGQALVWVE